MLTNDDFSELLEKYNYSYKQGDTLKGTVIGYEGNNVLVDINSKTAAICPSSEILAVDNDTLKIGESYSFIVISPEDENGVFYLSHKKVAFYENAKKIEEKFKNNETVEGVIVNIVKGGAIASVDGVKGFIPLSHLKQAPVSGQKLQLKILAADFSHNNFILSEKKAYNDALSDIKKEIFDKVELNMVVKGTVVRLTDFGAFIDIGGVDGLLPLSQISWRWIDKPSDVLKCDEKIDVEIIGIDKEKQRLSLSLKSLSDNPWISAGEVISDNKIVKGKVTAIKPFGAFVEVFENVEGLLNKVQTEQYFQKYQKELQENDEIEVLIKRFDSENQKINLEIV